MSDQPQPFPVGPHDETLVSNVHPPDWKNPEPAERYNLVVLGAGTAGLIAASGAAGLGAKVALVERDLLGGDCLNVGCVPSKAILRSAHEISQIRRAADVGISVPSGVRADFGAVMDRVRRVRARISPHDSARRFRDELGIDVFLGEARFVSGDCIEVDGKQLRFRKAVVATGARAVVPPIDGLAEAGFLTNENVFNLTELPRRLLVLGGGPIGCELAQAFRQLGSEVTIADVGTQFLPREDPDAARILAETFEREGIEVCLQTALTRVVRDGDERVVTLERDGKSESRTVDAILVGVGRAANVDGMGLEEAGVNFERDGIIIDDRLRTSNRRIFAAGDVAMQYKFTHAADFAARAVIRNALFFGREKLSALSIPWCTYTQPEIAHVGLGEQQARSQGIEFDTYTRNFAEVDRAIAEGDEEGFVKILTAKGSDRILGATIVGSHAGDLISEVSVAMAGKLGLSRLSSVIHPYPTRAEAIRQTGDAYNRTRLTPGVRRFFERLLAFRL